MRAWRWPSGPGLCPAVGWQRTSAPLSPPPLPTVRASPRRGAAGGRGESDSRGVLRGGGKEGGVTGSAVQGIELPVLLGKNCAVGHCSRAAPGRVGPGHMRTGRDPGP